MQLDTPAARLSLLPSKEPYWQKLKPGLALGYYRGERCPSWYVRERIGSKYLKARIGTPDDEAPANGTEILSYQQAVKKAIGAPIEPIEIDLTNSELRKSLPSRESPYWHKDHVDIGDDGASIRIGYRKYGGICEWMCLEFLPELMGESRSYVIGEDVPGRKYGQCVQAAKASARRSAPSKNPNSPEPSTPIAAWNEAPVVDLKGRKSPPWVKAAREDLEATSAMFAAEFAERLWPRMFHANTADEQMAAFRQAFVETVESA